MRILLITDEVWNDVIHGNNILTNWFEGFDAEFANIYCSPGMPLNNCCKKYFQITDAMMAKSLVTRQKAGHYFVLDEKEEKQEKPRKEENQKKFYAFMKSITTETLRAVREFLWMHGKYDEVLLKRFIDDVRPDIIFAPRYASRKLLRLERMVYKYAKVPMVAFTGDDEYSLQQFRFSPVFWVRRLLLRKDLRKNAKLYSKYYTFSQEQAEEYRRIFGIEAECLYKCGDFPERYQGKEVHKPISMVYAGKLYCNRWKVLADIGRMLAEVNEDEVKFILNIYTKDKLNRRQMKALNDSRNIFVRGAVAADKLREIYQSADIALQVESLDIKNRLLTRYSFSTKIIDCLSSTCAVMAFGWERQSGFRYLKETDAAICVSDIRELKKILIDLNGNGRIITQYQKKAWECGRKYHSRKMSQEKIYDDFAHIIG